jgi:hypothetical protein
MALRLCAPAAARAGVERRVYAGGVVPLVKEVEERTEASPAKALADAGFYSNQNVRELTQKRVASTYMCPTEPGAGAEHGQAGAYDWAQPGAQSGTESHAEEIAQPGGTASVRTAQDAGGTGVWRAQATAWDAQFRTRGPAKVATEFTLVALAYNLTRPFVRRRALESRRTGETGEIEKAEQGACHDKPVLTHTLRALPHPKPEFFSTRGVVPSRIRCVSRVRAANRCLTEARWAS